MWPSKLLLLHAISLLWFGVGQADATLSVGSYAPLPPAASAPPISEAVGYRVEAFGNGAYMVTDGIYQSMFLVAPESVILIDAPPTIGHKLLYAIGNTTKLSVSHLIYSHAHADHIGAAGLFGNNMTIIAHDLTAYELAEAPSASRPHPTKTFKDTLDVKVGNQTLELSYHGPNHDPGNIFIYAPRQRVLMVVDIVFPGWAPFSQLGEASSIPGFIKSHLQILEYDFNYFIGGHLGRVGTRADVEIQQQYVQDLRNNCLEAILLSATAPNSTNNISVFTIISAVTVANPGNSWALFKVYLTEVTNYCANKTVAGWINRLGGTDVYTYDNAYAMVESLRIDFNVLGPFGTF
jgi:glyoxylase-like metal-dependent hydrolase (beta-lactamase superfamily II)